MAVALIVRSPWLFLSRENPIQGLKATRSGRRLLRTGVSFRYRRRSFKYHRPRGLIAAGLDEPNGIVQVGEGAHSTPNLKAPSVELFERLVAKPVNAWPSLAFDLLSVNSVFGRFIPGCFLLQDIHVAGLASL